jgi:hypothetical protein
LQKPSDGQAPHFWHFLDVLKTRNNSMLFSHTLMAIGSSGTLQTERGLVR